MANIHAFANMNSNFQIALPQLIREYMKLKPGEIVEMVPSGNGRDIIIRRSVPSWEDTVVDWYRKHYHLLSSRCRFVTDGEYTVCFYNPIQDVSRCGYAKRMYRDKYNAEIARVAAYARAIGTPIDKLVGWKG